MLETHIDISNISGGGGVSTTDFTSKDGSVSVKPNENGSLDLSVNIPLVTEERNGLERKEDKALRDKSHINITSGTYDTPEEASSALCEMDAQYSPEIGQTIQFNDKEGNLRLFRYENVKADGFRKWVNTCYEPVTGKWLIHTMNNGDGSSRFTVGTSSDGLTWEYKTLPYVGDWVMSCGGGGVFLIARGDTAKEKNGYLISRDGGETWEYKDNLPFLYDYNSKFAEPFEKKVLKDPPRIKWCNVRYGRGKWWFVGYAYYDYYGPQKCACLVSTSDFEHFELDENTEKYGLQNAFPIDIAFAGNFTYILYYPSYIIRYDETTGDRVFGGNYLSDASMITDIVSTSDTETRGDTTTVYNVDLLTIMARNGHNATNYSNALMVESFTDIDSVTANRIGKGALCFPSGVYTFPQNDIDGVYNNGGGSGWCGIIFNNDFKEFWGIFNNHIRYVKKDTGDVLDPNNLNRGFYDGESYVIGYNIGLYEITTTSRGSNKRSVNVDNISSFAKNGNLLLVTCGTHRDIDTGKGKYAFLIDMDTKNCVGSATLQAHTEYIGWKEQFPNEISTDESIIITEKNGTRDISAKGLKSYNGSVRVKDMGSYYDISAREVISTHKDIIVENLGEDKVGVGMHETILNPLDFTVSVKQSDHNETGQIFNECKFSVNRDLLQEMRTNLTTINEPLYEHSVSVDEGKYVPLFSITDKVKHDLEVRRGLAFEYISHNVYARYYYDIFGEYGNSVGTLLLLDYYSVDDRAEYFDENSIGVFRTNNGDIIARYTGDFGINNVGESWMTVYSYKEFQGCKIIGYYSSEQNGRFYRSAPELRDSWGRIHNPNAIDGTLTVCGFEFNCGLDMTGETFIPSVKQYQTEVTSADETVKVTKNGNTFDLSANVGKGFTIRGHCVNWNRNYSVEVDLGNYVPLYYIKAWNLGKSVVVFDYISTSDAYGTFAKYAFVSRGNDAKLLMLDYVEANDTDHFDTDSIVAMKAQSISGDGSGNQNWLILKKIKGNNDMWNIIDYYTDQDNAKVTMYGANNARIPADDIYFNPTDGHQCEIGGYTFNRGLTLSGPFVPIVKNFYNPISNDDIDSICV